MGEKLLLGPWFIRILYSKLLTFLLMIWLEKRGLKGRFGQNFLKCKARAPLLPFQRRFSA